LQRNSPTATWRSGTSQIPIGAVRRSPVCGLRTAFTSSSRQTRSATPPPGIGLTAWLEARGHAALEARATSAHEEFIAAGEFSFRRRDNVARLGDVVKFNWEMVSKSGEIAGVGLEFLVLDPDGRIRSDCQFIES
jgi:hypothetical protein